MGSCRRRAQKHADVGDALAEAARNEWAAVCWFYSAYHLTRAALLSDPVFEDTPRLQNIYHLLVPEDRHVTRHRGRRGPHPEMGINDLVEKLYPALSGSYERLHQASIDVRYEDGLRPELSVLRSLLTTITDAYDNGQMRAVLQKSSH